MTAQAISSGRPRLSNAIDQEALALLDREYGDPSRQPKETIATARIQPLAPGAYPAA
jgi:hypothetical protein